jgi:hypothetical protein
MSTCACAFFGPFEFCGAHASFGRAQQRGCARGSRSRKGPLWGGRAAPKRPEQIGDQQLGHIFWAAAVRPYGGPLLGPATWSRKPVKTNPRCSLEQIEANQVLRSPGIRNIQCAISLDRSLYRVSAPMQNTINNQRISARQCNRTYEFVACVSDLSVIIDFAGALFGGCVGVRAAGACCVDRCVQASTHPQCG